MEHDISPEIEEPVRWLDAEYHLGIIDPPYRSGVSIDDMGSIVDVEACYVFRQGLRETWNQVRTAAFDAEKETNTHPALDGSQVYHSAKHVMRASDVASLYPHIVLPKVLEEMQETARSYREKTGRTLSPDLLFNLADIDCTALGRTLYGKFAEENKRP